MNRGRHTTSKVLMIRPSNFGYNEETAKNNAFQVKAKQEDSAKIQSKARDEFDAFVDLLLAEGVDVVVAKDSVKPIKPDAVFPNNWVSFHEGGKVITYPMFAPTRRRERRSGVIRIVKSSGVTIDQRLSLEFNEKLGIFLEGTGSIVFDREAKKAYACLSPRTHKSLLEELCAHLNYTPITFEAVDDAGQQIYHTNVMMTMGETFVVICLDSVRDAKEKKMLLAHFKADNKEVVEISMEQVRAFAGNMIQLKSEAGASLLIMSEQAHKALTKAQIKALEKHSKLVHAPIYTIEKHGGGSARCMIAEIFE